MTPRPLIFGGIPVKFRGRTVYEIAGGNGEDDDQQSDDDIDLLGGDDQQDDDSGGGDGDSGDDQPPAWWTTASAQIDQKIESAIDRRLNTRRQRQQGGQQGSGQQGGQGQQSSGPNSADVREARSVFRDELTHGQQITLSREEREFVNTLAAGVVLDAMRDEPDPDRAGTVAARTVATEIQKLRRAHQNRLVRELEKIGALDRSKMKGQRGPSNRQGSEQLSPSEAMAAGAERARQMQANRGLTVPEQNK
jgi:hypothetical protein